VTDAHAKAAVAAVMQALFRHSNDPSDHLAILGVAISTIARATSDPIEVAQFMVKGIEGWIEHYRSGAT